MPEIEQMDNGISDLNRVSPFKNLPVRIIIPVLFTIILFILTIFLLILPLLEQTMMDGKTEGIKHLTESAWSTLNLYYEKVQRGTLSTSQAKMQAINHLGELRYGPESKDYFWINDMTPRMVMHPYRPDLVGQDISDFKDPTGKRLFAQVVKTVKLKKAGYVDYLWQWKEDSNKIVPKISYVRGFKPWDWIIGTGIYVEDVREDISQITRHLTYTCLLIMVLILLLSGYIIWQSAKANQERINAQEQSHLREKQLLHADKMTSLGILVAGVAHEINNPATSLMLNAPNLKKAWNSFVPILDEHFKKDMNTMVCMMPYNDLSTRIEKMLTSIEDSASRIKIIINELKDFSRPTGTTMEQDIAVNQVVNKTLGLMKTIIKKTTTRFSVTYEAGLPKIEGSPHQLQQVIINLVVNACQAIQSPDQAIQVSTSMDTDAGFIIIEVKDDGPGVKPDDLQKLKEPFFTTKRDSGGTGLGLSISAKIINDHRGLLEFHSKYGKGLTSRVFLPYNKNIEGS